MDGKGFAVDRAKGDWYIFGEHPTGEVDLADLDGDVVIKVSRAKAKQIIALRDRFVQELDKILDQP